MLITTPQALAVYIKDYRKRQQLTQTQIANQVGLRQATISDFEKMPNKASVETFFKIATALDLEVHLLANPTDNADNEGQDEW